MNTTASPRALTIGKLSKRTDCNIETIRYYERIGILPAPPRSAGGFRLYSDDHLKRLMFVRRSRQLGFSLDEIRVLLELVDGGDCTCAEVKALTLNHVAEIRRKVTDLRKLERVLKQMAAQCDGGKVPACPIIEALYRGTN